MHGIWASGEEKRGIFKQIINNGAETSKTDERHHSIDSRGSINPSRMYAQKLTPSCITTELLKIREKS